MTVAELLEFERGRWLHPGLKEQTIRERFGVTPVRYYQHLNRVIESGSAVQLDPIVTRRLQRLRQALSATRMEN